MGDLLPRDNYGLSIVLGSAEFSMLELAGLYASLGNKGYLNDIKISTNEIVQDFEEQKLYSPESAFVVRKILERNPAPGTGLILSEKKIPTVSGPQTAFKTGTSIGFKDAWSLGLYGPYVIAVWIGNFSGEGNPVFLGRETATPLLFDIVSFIEPTLDNKKYTPERIPGVQNIQVCAVSGSLPTEYCQQTKPAYFIPGISPIKKCEIHRPVFINKESGYRVREEGEKTERVIREIWPTDLLKLFLDAGVPRPVPPPYENSMAKRTISSKGGPPRIVSPLEGASYIIRPNSKKYDHIPLMGSVDGEVKEIFWFANGLFLGKGDAQKTLLWKPDTGIYDLILLDDRGLSTDRQVTVTMEP